MNNFASSLAALAALLAAHVSAQVAPAPATPVVPGVAAPVVRPLPASQWTAAQIRQSFELADTDSNGQLTRAEAQQLTIMPRTFEDMDENKDGMVNRAEYESVFAR